MATHSSVLAWRIPGTAQTGGLPSMGSHEVGHDRSDLAAAAGVAQSFVTPCTAERPGFLAITNSGSLLKLMSIASVMPSNHRILCRPLLLPPSSL